MNSKIDVFQLSQENKLALSKKAIETTRKAEPETQRLLSLLQRYDPRTAGGFRIEDGVIQDVPFRLVSSSQAASNIDSFIALSYCWHSDDWSTANDLEKPEERRPIAPSMVQGLLSQRESENKGIWIDQRCIDQDNSDEKNLAVASMDYVYKSTRGVIVVLEDVKFNTEQVSLLHKLIKYQAPRISHSLIEIWPDYLVS